jgi:hypothetical protein
MSGGQCLDGSPPRKLRSLVITILHNSHYLIETSIMINQSGLDTVPPFFFATKISPINFVFHIEFIYLFIYLFIEDFNE